MTLREFYKKYCADIEEKVVREHVSRCPYPYDVTDHDEENRVIYCIRASDEQLIDVMDIIFENEAAYKQMYPTQAAWNARVTYLSKLSIFDGEDALRSLSIELEREKKKRDKNIKEAERLLNDQCKASEMFTFG